MGRWGEKLGSTPKDGGRWGKVLAAEEITQPPSLDGGFSFKEMVKNIPSSAVSEGKEMLSVVAHPQQTKNALTGLGAGLIEKAIPGEQNHEHYVDAVKKFYSDRYGGFDNFKKTLEKDPIGTLADVASILSGLGGVTKGGAKVAGKVATIPGAITKTGSVLAETGKALEPLNIIAKGVIAPFKLIPQKIPESLYRKAAIMSTTIPAKDRVSAIKTALKEGIPLTQKGIDKLWKRVFELDDEVSEIINSKSSAKIPTEKVIAHLKEAKDYFSDYPGNKAILKKIDRFEIEITEQLGKSISAKSAQAMKKKVYTVLRDAYKGEVKIPDKKSRMAIANGVRTELEKLFPEISKLNKQEGALLNLNTSISRAVERISQQRLVSWRDLTIGTSVGFATDSPAAGASALVAMMILSDAKVQSHIAILLNKAKTTKYVNIKAPLTNTRLGAFQAGRFKSEIKEHELRRK